MFTSDSAADIQNRAAGPVEPGAIVLIGGPLNGKKVADVGQSKGQTPEGDLYVRVRMDAGGAAGRMSFDVLAYWGKAWDGNSG
jgi:hypothetical protein